MLFFVDRNAFLDRFRFSLTMPSVSMKAEKEPAQFDIADDMLFPLWVDKCDEHHIFLRVTPDAIPDKLKRELRQFLVKFTFTPIDDKDGASVYTSRADLDVDDERVLDFVKRNNTPVDVTVHVRNTLVAKCTYAHGLFFVVHVWYCSLSSSG